MATIAERLEEAEVTDSLLRTENPLAKLEGGGGTVWHLLTGDVSISQTLAPEGWRVTTAYPGGTDGAQLDDEPHLLKVSGPTHAYTIGTVSLTSGNTASRWYGLWALKVKGAVSGYRVRAEVEAELSKCKLLIEKATAGSFEVIAEETGVALENKGGKEVATFAVVVGEGNVYFYVKKPAGSFEQFLEVADATYTEGYSSMEGRGNFMRLKNFKTGTFTLSSTFEGEASATVELTVTAIATTAGDTSVALVSTVAGVLGKLGLPASSMQLETNVEGASGKSTGIEAATALDASIKGLLGKLTDIESTVSFDATAGGLLALLGDAFAILGLETSAFGKLGQRSDAAAVVELLTAVEGEKTEPVISQSFTLEGNIVYDSITA